MRRIAAVAGALVVATAGTVSAATTRPVPADSPARELAAEAGLDVRALREVFSVGAHNGRLRLIASAPARDRLCVSSEGQRGATLFASAFRCFPSAPRARQPLVLYGISDDSATGPPTARTSVAFFARPDVTRVVATTVSGRRIGLRLRPVAALRASVGGYAASRRLDRPPPRQNLFARTLTAYRGQTLVASVRVGAVCCSNPPTPTLTAVEVERAIEMALTHPEVQEITGSRALRVVPDERGELVGVWHTGARKEKIGAAVELEWDEPLAVARAWRSIAYDYTELSQPPYREGRVRLRANELRRVTVLVDLRRNKVVAVQPGPRCCG